MDKYIFKSVLDLLDDDSSLTEPEDQPSLAMICGPASFNSPQFITSAHPTDDNTEEEYPRLIYRAGVQGGVLDKYTGLLEIAVQDPDVDKCREIAARIDTLVLDPFKQGSTKARPLPKYGVIASIIKTSEEPVFIQGREINEIILSYKIKYAR